MSVENELVPITEPTLPSLSVSHDDIVRQAAEWFGFDIANGDARQDTIDAYMSALKHWLTWCQVAKTEPAFATKEHIKAFRKELIDSKSAPATISIKLTAIRKFYESALQRGYIDQNPAIGVRSPKNRSASEEVVEHLSDEEANKLFKTIPKDDKLKSIRDRAIIALMTIEGLRRVEIHRANDEDITYEEGRMRLLIHGKGKDRYARPRQSDVSKIIAKYIEKRGPVKEDINGLHPLFVEVSKSGTPLARLSRDGISKMVSKYFLQTGIRKAVDKSAPPKRQRSCHSLRHTCGTDIYKGTGDLKLVQETLGHAGIAMAAKYSHVDKRAKARVTEVIPIEVE